MRLQSARQPELIRGLCVLVRGKVRRERTDDIEEVLVRLRFVADVREGEPPIKVACCAEAVT